MEVEIASITGAGNGIGLALAHEFAEHARLFALTFPDRSGASRDSDRDCYSARH